eukprot:1398355-Rhodomonas_salina.2
MLHTQCIITLSKAHTPVDLPSQTSRRIALSNYRCCSLLRACSTPPSLLGIQLSPPFPLGRYCQPGDPSSGAPLRFTLDEDRDGKRKAHHTVGQLRPDSHSQLAPSVHAQ